MLRGLDPLLVPELLHVLALMGHGDQIAVVDANFPSHSVAARTVHGRVVSLAGASMPEAAGAILSLLPLDHEGGGAVRVMAGGEAVVAAVHQDLQRILDGASSPPCRLEPLERFAFYEACAHSYAIVQTGERRLFGNALIRKGVVAPAG
jgi:L-fucose mutarotase